MLRARFTLFWAFMAMALLVGACGDEVEMDVPEGRYQVQVEGGITDTLVGAAIFREHENGMGLELGSQEGPGLSIQVEAPSIGAGTYDVEPPQLLEGTQPDSLVGVMGFLSFRDAEFEATGGTLRLSHVGGGEVRGKIDFQMEGGAGPGSGDLSIRVTGVLRATGD